MRRNRAVYGTRLGEARGYRGVGRLQNVVLQNVLPRRRKRSTENEPLAGCGIAKRPVPVGHVAGPKGLWNWHRRSTRPGQRTLEEQATRRIGIARQLVPPKSTIC